VTTATLALQQLSEEIDRRRTALLTEYSDEDLHQLRVTIRRVRGLLVNKDSSESMQLRRAWSRLADQTNPARDWDTLASYLEQHLAAEILAPHRAALATGQAQARQQVLDMLSSTLWSATYKQWRCFLQRAGAEDEPALPWQDIVGAARARAARAWQTAREVDKPCNWHRLRIAVKDLRYSLDTLAPVSPESLATLALCKDLQSLLGNWHDTVVHRQLLEQIASAEPVLAEEALVQLILSLLPDLQTLGDNCLVRVHQQLESGGLA
jgi:CHAD domain-containing protein